jgi:hypothetical protein
MKSLALALAGALSAGCNGTTGGALTSFAAFVAGPAGVVAGAPLTFTTAGGYDLTLTEARFHLAAIYLNKSVPSSGSSAQECILPGVYVDQVFGACAGSGACGLDVDLLSPNPVPFPTAGTGTLDPAFTAEVWLSGGDINTTEDETPILQVAGSATKDGLSWPFSGQVHIGANHTMPPPNVATPGTYPICRSRIVREVIGDVKTEVGVTVPDGGTLTLRVEPAHLFDEVQFGALAPGGSPTTVVIPDDNSLVGEQLFDGLTSSAGPPEAGVADVRVYQFDVSNP